MKIKKNIDVAAAEGRIVINTVYMENRVLYYIAQNEFLLFRSNIVYLNGQVRLCCGLGGVN